MAAVLLQEAGIDVTAGAGRHVLAAHIRQIRPDLQGSSRQIIADFVVQAWHATHREKVPPKNWVPGTPLPKQARGFYDTLEWQQLRYRVLKQRGRRCECCGRTPTDGVAMHVDHIKPRSKWPELALVETNLQILCKDCNLGKSNFDEIDWRTAPVGQPQ